MSISSMRCPGLRGLGSSLGLPLLLAAGLSGPAALGAAETRQLYTLTTSCRVAGAAAQPCEVEALDQGEVTLYRHRIGPVRMTVRIRDKPLRMERWNGARKRWQPLKQAAARFSTNTICFNGSDLCVVNPNYLNSIREDRPEATAGRDLVMVRFDSVGRVNLSCYDEGCGEVKA
ncbi:MAG: hypothetical protein VKK98_02905 [Cyanobacteriota bacterium]|nr:hypothetical protein [Cyanobacteriota bacterium]